MAMTALDALQTGLRTLVREPAAVGTHYLLAVGVTFAARTPILLGLGAALALLQAQGRIAPVVRQLDQVNWQANSPTIPPELQEAIRDLVTPGTVLIALLSILATVVLLVVARGIASAATLDALAAGVEDRDPLLGGTAGIGGDWLSFVALGIVRGIVWVGTAGLAFGALALMATGIGLVVGLPLLLLTLVGALVMTLLLAFVGPAIAVDDVGLVSALGRSLRFPVRRPVAFVLYALVAIAAFVTATVCVVLFNVLGIPRMSALLILLGVNPVVDAVKIGLYAERGMKEKRSEREWKFPVEESSDRAGAEGDEATAESTSTQSIRSRLAGGLRRGRHELAGFVRERPLLNLAGVATLLVGVGLGWLLTAPYATQLPVPTDVRGVFGAVPVAAFVNIAANNWLVAVAQGFGGVGLGVPTVANLLFNGVLIGGLAGVFDPTAFVALVVPHGVIEVPALGIAGGLGYHLGGVSYRALRGQIGAEAVGEELQRAAWVVVGLVPLFVLAAFVEAFLTPLIAAMVLGG